ncbi:unnamed protein product [Didymodactylos carnosus]|uniref:Aminoacyl-transfer RNA synthetases class-II family profile domain-containing protein n=1 Tax=Didymodactylos carnosus TaxID=1234261 RepID=A0A8S2CT80_9BILA|nr:unnamed protein product [Didymodactylos carnosus]CAF3581228.1 unnamed protein product [Didymodactylos carnosus]
MIYRSVWKAIEQNLSVRFAALGVKDMMMPLLIPAALIAQEKQHIAGFSPELFTITHKGDQATSEFYWQEGHTVHATSEEAFNFARSMINEYSDFAQKLLCLPLIIGEKTPGERFAGADNSFTIESLMQDGQALQCGTSHYLGQKFANAYGTKFTDANNQKVTPYQSS